MCVLLFYDQMEAEYHPVNNDFLPVCVCLKVWKHTIYRLYQKRDKSIYENTEQIIKRKLVFSKIQFLTAQECKQI